MSKKAKELTKEDIEKIRSSEDGYNKLAKQFGVNNTRIEAIKKAESLEKAYKYAKGKPEKVGDKPSADTPPANSSDAKPKPAGTKKTTFMKTELLEEANILEIMPKVLTFSSATAWLAKRFTELEWGWPVMDMGDWLDTYIYHTLKQRGVTLGYHIENRKDNGGSDGS